MTPAIRRLAELWYGPMPLSEVARLLGQSETRVRVDAVMVHKLGCRKKADREFWAGYERSEHRRKKAKVARA